MTTAHSGRALMAEVLMLRHGSWFAAYYTRYVRRPTFGAARTRQTTGIR
jgi:hypothetical protein